MEPESTSFKHCQLQPKGQITSGSAQHCSGVIQARKHPLGHSLLEFKQTGCIKSHVNMQPQALMSGLSECSSRDGENTILTSLKAQRKSFHSHFFFTPLKVMAFLTSCNQHAHSPKVPFNTITQNCCVTHFGLLCAIIIRHHSPGLPGSRRLFCKGSPSVLPSCGLSASCLGDGQHFSP